MPKKVLPNGDVQYGPFKGSKKNGGRPIYDIVKKDGSRTTVDKARADYESKHGRLSRDTDVDHKDSNKKNDSMRNLQPMQHGANVAKENRRRAK